MTALLPPNATALEQAVEALLAARFADLPADFRPLWSALDCPEELLPWLAWALSIDQWDATWPVAVRRARIASAIEVQRIKGTARSVRDVIASFGGAVALREWFQQEPPADPHTFQLLVALGGTGIEPPSAEYIDAVIAEVGRTKPARSHFTFALAVDVTGAVGTLAAAQALTVTRLALTGSTDPAPATALSFAGWALGFAGDYLTVGT